jgi:hypothetical protein
VDRSLAESLGRMTFSSSGWTKKYSIFMTGDEGTRRKIKDQAPIHLLVEVEIEVA